MFSLTALVVLGLFAGAVAPLVVGVVEVKKCGSLNEDLNIIHTLSSAKVQTFKLNQEGGRTARVHPSCSITARRVLGVDYYCASNSPAANVICNLTATNVTCHVNFDPMSESLPPTQDPQGFLYAIHSTLPTAHEAVQTQQSTLKQHTMSDYPDI